MAAARLSPAATLLRNSRLFAVPAAIPLPTVEPSSEPISYSDSATTPYPTRAAIETSLASLNQGDWGLKRPLPIKTTSKSGTPLVRFQRGIDTPEHVVDFESAADHVITLRKYQELNLRITLPAPKTKKALQESRISPFLEDLDNTADHPPPALQQNTSIPWLDEAASERAERLPKKLKDRLLKLEGDAKLEAQSTAVVSTSPEQTLRRWRYSGPYLAGLIGLEFDAFLNTITREKKAAFRRIVKDDLVEKRAHVQRRKALDEGQTGHPAQVPAELTEQDVTEHIRYLRSEPGKFGPLIARFFDLADGPKPSSDLTDPWSYGRDTIAADLYKESGPPRTHPSAGLSYIKTQTAAANDPVLGPRQNQSAVAARLLKSRQMEHNRHKPYVGVAGFVVPQPEGPTVATEQNWKWQPVKDGQKLVVTPNHASVTQAGKLEIQTKMLLGWAVENDLPVDPTEKRATESSNATISPPKSLSSQLPSLDQAISTRRRPRPDPSQDIDEELKFLQSFNPRQVKNSKGGLK
jgi:hypothetical protein